MSAAALVSSTGLTAFAWRAADATIALTRSPFVARVVVVAQMCALAAAAHLWESLSSTPLAAWLMALGAAALALCPGAFILLAVWVAAGSAVAAAGIVVSATLVLFVAIVSAVRAVQLVAGLACGRSSDARRALGTITWWQSLDLIQTIAFFARDAAERFDPVACRKARDAASGVDFAPPPPPPPAPAVAATPWAPPPVPPQPGSLKEE